MASRRTRTNRTRTTEPSRLAPPGRPGRAGRRMASLGASPGLRRTAFVLALAVVAAATAWFTVAGAAPVYERTVSLVVVPDPQKGPSDVSSEIVTTVPHASRQQGPRATSATQEVHTRSVRPSGQRHHRHETSRTFPERAEGGRGCLHTRVPRLDGAALCRLPACIPRSEGHTWEGVSASETDRSACFHPGRPGRRARALRRRAGPSRSPLPVGADHARIVGARAFGRPAGPVRRPNDGRPTSGTQANRRPRAALADRGEPR
jgi:hypothetical protein